ncbi:hypothetical protein Vafri_13035, partial [Volvox africanus]
PNFCCKTVSPVMAAIRSEMSSTSCYTAFTDVFGWISGLLTDCCAPTVQPLRSQLEHQQPAKTTSAPGDQPIPNYCRAPEVVTVKESSVSPAVVFQSTELSSMLSSSFSSSSLTSSSLSSSMDNVESCTLEKPPAVEEASAVVSAVPCEKSAALATVLAMEEVEYGICTAALRSDQGTIEALTVGMCAQLEEAALSTEPETVQNGARDAFAAAMCKLQYEMEILAAPLGAQQAEMGALPMTLGTLLVETEASATSLSLHPQDEVEALEALEVARMLREQQEELEEYDNPNKPIKMTKEFQDRMDIVVQQLKDWIVMDRVALQSVERHLTVPRPYRL